MHVVMADAVEIATLAAPSGCHGSPDIRSAFSSMEVNSKVTPADTASKIG